MKKLIILSFFFFSFSHIQAQVVNNYNNKTKISAPGVFNQAYKQAIFSLQSPDSAFLSQKEMRENEEADGTKPFRLAEPIKVDINLIKSAQFIRGNEFVFGKFTLFAKNAKSLSINFDKFYLPNGTVMFIYNKDGRMITGPVTEKENNDRMVWGSSVYKGEELTVEIKTPKAGIDSLRLHISNVAYGYKDIFKDYGGYGLSGNCMVNVLCPLGNPWATERNSVALILNQNGGVWCSGALIGNACSYNIPYFLTANHCLNNGSEDVGLWRFVFQYWSPNCQPTGDDLVNLLFNGSVLRANASNSDFALLQLNTVPAQNSGLVYAGWDRTSTAATSATGIHHPRGDVMKISFSNSALATASYGTMGTNAAWRVNWSQVNDNGTLKTAVTQGGSSGSPLFDQNHRIVGQLYGGPSSCGGSATDYYGRLDLSWLNGTTASVRLVNWLDPNSTGATTMNSVNLNATVNTNFAITGGVNAICDNVAHTYTANVANPVTWAVNPSSGVVTYVINGNSINLTKQNAGVVTLTATVTGTCATTSRTIVVGSPTVTISAVKNGACNGRVQPWKLSATPAEPGSNWNWQIDYLSPNSSILFGTSNLATTTANVTGSGTVKVSYTDACTATTKTTGTAYIYSQCANRFMYTVAPNPASNLITVSTAKDKGIQQDLIFSIRITDRYGVVRKTLVYKAGIASVTFPIADLNAGTYIVSAYNNREWSSQPVIVQK